MSILDISNWTIDEINNSINTFKDTSLTDIGMVNCDIESINIVGEVATATLWINEDVGIDEYTGTAPLKIYKEDKVELRLSSPLLEGDTIEVIDGKLCHYHKMGCIILDKNYKGYIDLSRTLSNTIRFYITVDKPKENTHIVSNNFKSNIMYNIDNEHGYTSAAEVYIFIKKDKLSTLDVNGFKQWLSENPTIIIYELAEPYYEDITPLQSSIVLKTFNESSMTINTNLPIKANVSYRTNVPSISTLSNRVTEVSESDSVIQNLIDIIDDEVDE